MAENTEQLILEAFQRARLGGTEPVEGTPRASESLVEALATATRQLSELRSVNQSLAEVLALNTQAVTQNTSAQGLRSVAGEIGNVASGLLKSGFGLAPLITGLIRLFGGGKQEEPPPTPTRFELPPPVRFEAAKAPLGIGPIGLPEVSYGQDGRPRVVTQPPEGRREPAPAPVLAPQITVQVQAMDSRSFLDHSHEIARAVREAMLNMHPLNDVVTDL